MFKFPTQKSYSFSRYGREAANQLAREYCRRAHYFFSIWLHGRQDSFEYSQAHIDAYDECSEWLAWLDGLADEDRWSRQRAHVMRSLCPRLGRPRSA